MKSLTLEAITDAITHFRDERDWKQFHKPKDMALSLMLEAGELAEHFQWKSDEEIGHHLVKEKDEIGAELADVLYWTLLMAHDFGIDLSQAFSDKMKSNAAKYSIEKCRGRSQKYDQL